MSNYVEAGRRPFGGTPCDDAPRMRSVTLASDEPHGLERAAYYTLLAFAAAVQLSIAAADIFLTIAGLLWVGVLVTRRERLEVPRMFWPLAAYAGATLVASVFSVEPGVSLIDCKQLLLFAIVPIGYRLLPGRRALTAVDIIITVGAI